MEPARKFVVDPGNSRGNKISCEEIDQAVKDIANWVACNIPQHVTRAGRETAAFPYAVNKLFSVADGGLQLQETFKTLSVEELGAASEVGRVSIHWKHNYIPFARNNEGEFLVVEGEGQVLHWDLDTGVVEQLSEHLGLFLEELRNGLLSRKFSYLGEDCGLVEEV